MDHLSKWEKFQNKVNGIFGWNKAKELSVLLDRRNREINHNNALVKSLADQLRASNRTTTEMYGETVKLRSKLEAAEAEALGFEIEAQQASNAYEVLDREVREKMDDNTRALLVCKALGEEIAMSNCSPYLKRLYHEWETRADA